MSICIFDLHCRFACRFACIFAFRLACRFTFRFAFRFACQFACRFACRFAFSICIVDLHVDLHVYLHFDLPPPCSGKTAAGHRPGHQRENHDVAGHRRDTAGHRLPEGKHLVRPRLSDRRFSSRPPTQLRLARTARTNTKPKSISR